MYCTSKLTCYVPVHVSLLSTRWSMSAKVINLLNNNKEYLITCYSLYTRAVVQTATREKNLALSTNFLGSLMGLENCIEFGSSNGKYGFNTEHIFIDLSAML